MRILFIRKDELSGKLYLNEEGTWGLLIDAKMFYSETEVKLFADEFGFIRESL